MEKTLDNIIAAYLADKTDEQLKEILKDLDKAIIDAIEEDKKRCEKFINLVK